MTLDAKYFLADGSAREVRVRAEKEWLVIRDRDGTEIDRWHLHSLEQGLTPHGTTTLYWPPHPTKLEIVDRNALRRARWLPQHAHHRSRFRALHWLGWAAGAAFGLVLLIPFVARHVPWSLEKRLFADVALFPSSKLCDPAENPEGAAALRILRDRLFPIYPDDAPIPLEISIVREDQVNAVAFLAGRIYVFRGLLKEATGADELAGVLAHEIEHEKKRHLLQTIFRNSLLSFGAQIALLGGGSVGPGTLHALMRLKFGRGMEDEADRGGLQRLRDAQVSPEGFRKFFERHHGAHGVLTLLSDHPDDSDRASLVKSLEKYPSKPVLTNPQWLALKTFCR